MMLIHHDEFLSKIKSNKLVKNKIEFTWLRIQHISHIILAIEIDRGNKWEVRIIFEHNRMEVEEELLLNHWTKKKEIRSKEK